MSEILYLSHVLLTELFSLEFDIMYFCFLVYSHIFLKFLLHFIFKICCVGAFVLNLKLSCEYYFDFISIFFLQTLQRFSQDVVEDKHQGALLL